MKRLNERQRYATGLIFALLMSVAGFAGAAHHAKNLVISKAWIRQVPAGQSTSAAYFVIKNTGEETRRLVGVSADFSGKTEIHTVTQTDGVMRMKELTEGVTLEPNKRVALKPGGIHVMFMDLREDLVRDKEYAFTLKFADGKTRQVTAKATPRPMKGKKGKKKKYKHTHEHEDDEKG